MARKKPEELYDRSIREFKDHITGELGRAVEALYGLDIDLSKSYFGVSVPPGVKEWRPYTRNRNDRAVHAMREQIWALLEGLKSENFFKYYDDLGKL